MRAGETEVAGWVVRYLCLAPDARKSGLDFLLEAGDQFAVSGHKRLLGFDLGDDGLLGGGI